MTGHRERIARCVPAARGRSRATRESAALRCIGVDAPSSMSLREAMKRAPSCAARCLARRLAQRNRRSVPRRRMQRRTALAKTLLTRVAASHDDASALYCRPLPRPVIVRLSGKPQLESEAALRYAAPCNFPGGNAIVSRPTEADTAQKKRRLGGPSRLMFHRWLGEDYFLAAFLAVFLAAAFFGAAFFAAFLAMVTLPSRSSVFRGANRCYRAKSVVIHMLSTHHHW